MEHTHLHNCYKKMFSEVVPWDSYGLPQMNISFVPYMEHTHTQYDVSGYHSS